MSHLLQTFKFKELASHLADDEFDKFLSTLHREQGKELILELLCLHQDPSLTADMVQITITIIRERKNEQQQEDVLRLDTLSSCII